MLATSAITMSFVMDTLAEAAELATCSANEEQDDDGLSYISAASRRRDCHFTGTPSPSLLKRLLNEEGGSGRMTVSPTARRGPARASAGWAGGPLVHLEPDRAQAGLGAPRPPRDQHRCDCSVRGRVR